MRTSSAARQFATLASLAASLIVLLPAFAAAQEPVKSFDAANPRLTLDGQGTPSSPTAKRSRVSVGISAGVGWRTDIGDGASSYSGFDWVANVRFGLTTHLALEPEVGRWSHSQVTEFAGAGGWTQRSEFSQSDWYVGVNLIGRLPGSRLSFFYGGGPSVWRVSEQFSLEASAPLSGAPTQADHWDYADTKFGVQGVVGLDVDVTSRLQVFGLTRLQIVDREAYPFVFAVHGGVRLKL